MKSPERSIVHPANAGPTGQMDERTTTRAQHVTVKRRNEQHLWQLLERSRPHPTPHRTARPPLVLGEIYRRLPSRRHSLRRRRRRVTTTTREVEAPQPARTELQEVSKGLGLGPAPPCPAPPQVRSDPSAFFLRARTPCRPLRPPINLNNQSVLPVFGFF